MYFPFIRGNQFELVALRELAPKLPNYVYKPIIEPVRENLLPLVKTIKSINEFNVEPIIVVNSDIGDFKSKYVDLYSSLLSLDNSLNFIPCVKISDESVNYFDIINELPKRKAIFIPDLLDDKNAKYLVNSEYNILPVDTLDEKLAILDTVVLLDDPFQKKSRNADYKDKSKFSSLHKNYHTRPNTIGFGDYTIVGSEYSEAGGPAYVVTIHLSYIEKEHHQMLIRHFSSSPSKSPANPGGKFEEALANFILYIKNNPNTFDETFGIEELKRLYKNEHFPGLGLVKKISIQHHVETICNYLNH
ncbi:sce7725 family protein [Serratia marcescens]|uniref:sce7725 family protein n=1 Tax=Serratia marcescens TaxID=615 RepID=UPI003ED87749